MKPHPRIRKTVKWGGAAVTVLLMVVWIGSWRCDRVQTKSGGWTGVRHGRFVAGNWKASYEPVLRDPSAQGMSLVRASGFIDGRRLLVAVDELEASLVFSESSSPRLLFRGFAWHQSQDGWTIAVPLWSPVLLAVVPTFIAWRRDALVRRRARLNFCPTCNYDRAGIAAGAVCPECGTETT